MKKNVFKIAIVTAALLTAACKPGVGVGTDQSNNSGTSDDTSIKKSDASTVKRTNARTIKMPAMGLIVKSFNDLYPLINPKTGMWTYKIIKYGANPIEFEQFTNDEINEIFNINKLNTTKPEKTKKYKEYHSQVVSVMDRAIDGDFEERRKTVYSALALYFVNDAMSPAFAWPEYLRDGKARMQYYIIPKIFCVQFANAFLTEFALGIPEQTLSDTAMAHKIIADKLLNFGSDKIINLIKSTQEKTKSQYMRGVSVDMITGRGTSWQAGDAYYAGSQEGMKVTENGIDYFGNGKLSGQEILVSLDSTLDSSKTITRDINTGSTDSTSNAVKATTEVK